MKIHFIASIYGNKKNFKNIVSSIEKLGHSIVTYHYLLQTIDNVKKETKKESLKYTQNSAKWIKQADIVIFEASHPDSGIGFEAHSVLTHPKPLIVLIDEQTKHYPFPLNSIDNEYLQVITYNSHNLAKDLKYALDYATHNLESRLQIVLPNNLFNYLNRTSSKLHTSKAAILRKLIREHMRHNESQPQQI